MPFILHFSIAKGIHLFKLQAIICSWAEVDGDEKVESHTTLVIKKTLPLLTIKCKVQRLYFHLFMNPSKKTNDKVKVTMKIFYFYLCPYRKR